MYRQIEKNGRRKGSNLPSPFTGRFTNEKAIRPFLFNEKESLGVI